LCEISFSYLFIY